jgi:hypothetical protein
MRSIGASGRVPILPTSDRRPLEALARLSQPERQVTSRGPHLPLRLAISRGVADATGRLGVAMEDGKGRGKKQCPWEKENK